MGNLGKQPHMSMRTSQAGIGLIKNYESLRLDAHDVEGKGKLTIGYGHYNDPGVAAGMIITEAQAEAYLREDLRKHEKQVSRAVKVPLTQNQFDALVSFSFNTGAPADDSVYEEINKGNFDKAMVEWSGWRNFGTQFYGGIKKRRNDEIELFMGGDAQRDQNLTDHYEKRPELKTFIRDAVRQGLQEGTIGTDQILSLDKNLSREFYEHFFGDIESDTGAPTPGFSGYSVRQSERSDKDDWFKPGRGDLLVSKPGEPGNEHPDPMMSLAGADELEIHQMAEEVFSSLTLDDWAVIPNDDDPFGGRDPFADGMKWVPGLGPPPETP
ncbi:glycoside hydrolase family protein [Anderseniella sp. Alg231-50]|uniref:glycoside hydrolase family protein n=1 Tax=Anderseniella sp. Alg231-50 TaxID=1922226 RepID=UPI000D558C18